MSARVRFCYWCRQFAILDAKPDDNVDICVVGNVRVAKINAVPVRVAEGVCDACRAKTLHDAAVTR